MFQLKVRTAGYSAPPFNSALNFPQLWCELTLSMIYHAASNSMKLCPPNIQCWLCAQLLQKDFSKTTMTAFTLDTHLSRPLQTGQLQVSVPRSGNFCLFPRHLCSTHQYLGSPSDKMWWALHINHQLVLWEKIKGHLKWNNQRHCSLFKDDFFLSSTEITLSSCSSLKYTFHLPPPSPIPPLHLPAPPLPFLSPSQPPKCSINRLHKALSAKMWNKFLP